MDTLLRRCRADQLTCKLIKEHDLTLQDVQQAVDEFSEKFRVSHTSSTSQSPQAAE